MDSNQNLNIIQVVKEAVRAEFTAMFQPFVTMLNADLEQNFNELNNRINELAARLDKLDGGQIVAPKTEEGKEL